MEFLLDDLDVVEIRLRRPRSRQLRLDRPPSLLLLPQLATLLPQLLPHPLQLLLQRICPPLLGPRLRLRLRPLMLDLPQSPPHLRQLIPHPRKLQLCLPRLHLQLPSFLLQLPSGLQSALVRLAFLGDLGRALSLEPVGPRGRFVELGLEGGGVGGGGEEVAGVGVFEVCELVLGGGELALGGGDFGVWGCGVVVSRSSGGERWESGPEERPAMLEVRLRVG